MHRNVRSVRAAALWLMAALWMALVVAPSALAAPQVETMTLEELQSALDSAPSNSLPGYFKTVVKGSTIVTIPCDVLAVTGGASQDSALILFEANGPLIDKYGGIVAGMSGSPVYVDDSGTEKLVGAVSYGDWFTLHGTGLATPIEFMSKLQADYPTAPLALSEPVFTSSGPVDSISIALDAETALRTPGGERTLVARPLSRMFVSGLRPGTRMYRRLSSALASRGVELVATNASAGTAMQGGVPFSTELTAGAALAVLESRGDVWYGGIGTVTYADDGDVVAFGHPALYSGPSHLYMLNAWIDGVWPSTLEPYKLGRPGALRGTITQDRSAGIVGREDLFEAETTLTARVVDIDSGREATATVFVPRTTFSSPSGYAGMATLASYRASEKLYDQESVAGSARTTTTVEVSDGTTNYTIVMRNVWDQPWDIRYVTDSDIYAAVSSLRQVLSSGLYTIDIKSVDFQAEYSQKRNAAGIVSVDVPDGLRIGDNKVRIGLLQHGVAATQTIETTLTIPSGTELSMGTLSVSSANMGYYGMWWDDFYDGPYYYYGGGSRRTVANVVDNLSAREPNDVISVSFSESGSDYSSGYGSRDIGSAETTVQTPWYVQGFRQKRVPEIMSWLRPGVIAYGAKSTISGLIMGPEDSRVVTIFGTPRGGGVSESQMATALAYQPYPWSELYFTKLTGPYTKTTDIRMFVPGDGQYVSTCATTTVRVGAKVLLGASASTVVRGKKITFTASVAPTQTAGSKVAFQYYNAKARAWRNVSIQTLTWAPGASYATAKVTWAPPVGKIPMRAVFIGGPTNVAANSAQRTITVK